MAASMEFFHEPLPVRATVGSELSGILIEVDMVAWHHSAKQA